MRVGKVDEGVAEAIKRFNSTPSRVGSIGGFGEIKVVGKRRKGRGKARGKAEREKEGRGKEEAEKIEGVVRIGEVIEMVRGGDYGLLNERAEMMKGESPTGELIGRIVQKLVEYITKGRAEGEREYYCLGCGWREIAERRREECPECRGKRIKCL